MGRWGERLFEGDADLDEASYISQDAGIELLNYEPHEEYPDPTSKGLEATREHLNSGVLDTLFEEYKTKKAICVEENLRFVFLAALAMRVGAIISPSNMELVRSCIPKLDVAPKYSSPFRDTHFRGPAKIQIEGALARYKNDGTPYDFYADRCGGPHCGKAAGDLAASEKLQKCGKCKEVCYCSKDCQAAAWPDHKKSCKTPEQRERQRPGILLNV